MTYRFNQTIEAKWECLHKGCNAKGKKWIKQRDARNIGDGHNKKKHGGGAKILIIKRVKVS